MNTNEIPMSVVLEQSQRYTASQMKILYSEQTRTDRMFKDSVRKLYEKADKCGDDVAINILCSKYDMIAVFEKDLSGLPQVTAEQTDKSFKEIYEMIKSINPYSDDVVIRKRRVALKKNYGKDRKRRYGSNVFCTCFKETDHGVYFSLRSYLYKTSTTNIKMIAKALDRPKEVLTYIVPDLINWCLKQPLVKEEVISFLRLYPDGRPIPLEDIVDMENGKIKVIKESINTIK